MDFESLLHQAQRNEKGNRSGGSYYKTKFEPPKKESKTNKLSANIQKFLAKKEEDEKRKLEESKRKCVELLAMRDEKTKNKIKKSLKVIKSANKSVLDDAVDNNNTAVTLVGPDQPDEDDYGYVSQEASVFYSKMMEKYSHIPDEEKFSSAKKTVNMDLCGTKDRVKAAILRHQEEESMPHKRKRKSHPNESPHDDYYEEEEKIVEEKPKPRKPAPPPLDFQELLKIAEKKQFEPVVVETKKEQTEEPERPMTKKQRREYEQYKAYKDAKMRREQEEQECSKDSLKKRKAEVPSKSEMSSKPPNPLSIRIPKIGEKTGDSRKSLTNGEVHNSGGRGKERAQSDRKDMSSSDLKYRREERESDKRSSKQTEERSSSHYEKSFKIPNKSSQPSSSKSAIDSNNQTSHKSDKSGTVSHSSDKYASSANSSKSADNHRRPVPSKHTESRRPEHLAKKSVSNDRRIEKKAEFLKQDAARLNNLNQGRLPIKTSSDDRNKLSSKSARIGQEIQTRKYLPQDIRYQKMSGDTKDLKQSSSGVKQGVRPPSEVRALKSGDGKRSELDNRGMKSQVPNRGGKPLPSSNIKDAKSTPVDSRGSRPQSSLDAKSVKPASSGSNEIRPGTVANAKTRPFPPSDVKGVKQFPPDVRGSRQFSPADGRGPRQFPPRDTILRHDKRPVKRQRIDDEDSEYDSELDDFIDDGPQEGNDYSKYIKEIFGYDKSKYKDVDDEDIEESNFSRVMHEEFVSKKIGLMEDLEDMRQEALEKAKKKDMTNKKRRINDD